ncbi:MAG: hypothetical protein Q4Q17_04295 [Tissierellia bacterium]|nr:hypothetical protein [Tissierellia bacterium]
MFGRIYQKIQTFLQEKNKQKLGVLWFFLFIYVVVGILIESVRVAEIPQIISQNQRTPEIIARIHKYTALHTFLLLTVGILAIAAFVDAIRYMFSHRVGHPKRYFIFVFICDLICLMLLLKGFFGIWRADHWLYKTAELVVPIGETILPLIGAVVMLMTSHLLRMLSDRHRKRACEKEREMETDIALRMKKLRERL